LPSYSEVLFSRRHSPDPCKETATALMKQLQKEYLTFSYLSHLKITIKFKDTGPIKKDLQRYNFFIILNAVPSVLINPFFHIIFILSKGRDWGLVKRNINMKSI
jgi:hypothetical protein